MSAFGSAFANFHSGTGRPEAAPDATISHINKTNSSAQQFASAISRSVRFRRMRFEFTNILRRAFFLNHLFPSFLVFRNSAHMSKRNVYSCVSFYRRSHLACSATMRKISRFLQEDSVPRFTWSAPAANVDSPHPLLLPAVLAGVLVLCAVFLGPQSSEVTQRPLALAAPVLDRLAASAPTLNLDLGSALFGMPSTKAAIPGASSGPAGSATVNGRVTYDGTPKKLRPIDMSAEPNCAKFYQTPPMPDINLTGSDKAMPNVVVYVSAGAPDENFTGPVVHINQRGCRYTPHIVAVQANQEVWVKNDDAVTHSVHPMARVNTEWNRSQPPGTPPVVIRYTQPEFIRVKCELHPWMHGVLAVFKNSHHAITDNTGAFTLDNLPPGKYTVTAWHEVYGTQSKEITVGAGQSADLNFTFKVTPY